MGTTSVTSDELTMPLRFATIHFYGGQFPTGFYGALSTKGTSQ
jgi:hypothetical protein